MGYDLDFDQIEGDSYNRSSDGLHQLSVELSEILDLTGTDADIAVTSSVTNLFIDDAPTKLIAGRVVYIDTSPMTAADTYEISEHYRIKSGAGYVEMADPITISGVQSAPGYAVKLSDYRWGAKVTMQKKAGTDRTFTTEAIREV